LRVCIRRHPQDGGGACGRRPHSRSHLRLHGTLALMSLPVALLGGRPRDRAGEHRRRRRPDARSPARRSRVRRQHV